MEPKNLMEQISNFSSTFLIDNDITEGIRVIIDRCIRETFKVKFYHVMLDGKQVNGQPGLATAETGGQAWCNDDADAVPIYSDNTITSYRAQSTYAYQEQKPLWIISKDEGPLNKSEEYIDHWSSTHENKIKKLPNFENPNKQDVKTSVIVPLKHGEKHVFGFICLESEECIKGDTKISDRAKEEFEKLANSIGAILSAHENYSNRKSSTRKALERLKKLAKDYRLSCPLSKPTVFFGSSSKADKQVLGIIRRVLDNFGDEVEVKYWSKDESPGFIPKHIKEVIFDCRFGICYFSEPIKKENQNKDSDTNREDQAKHRYIDNPNVIFEAGMLDSLVSSVDAAPTGWIPIREEDSPSAPFDFAQQRMIIVKRMGIEKKEINEEELTTNLKDRLRELLK